jgi:hypothetical protein
MREGQYAAINEASRPPQPLPAASSHTERLFRPRQRGAKFLALGHHKGERQIDIPCRGDGVASSQRRGDVVPPPLQEKGARGALGARALPRRRRAAWHAARRHQAMSEDADRADVINRAGIAIQN